MESKPLPSCGPYILCLETTSHSKIFSNLSLHFPGIWKLLMHFRINIVVLFIFSLPLAAAQQLCYWPNGSGIGPDQGIWTNCYSSQDSACCLSGDVCLSNGLCYGSLSNNNYGCPCMLAAADSSLLRLVQTSSWSNLWRCAPVNNEPVQWWCGNETKIPACHAGIDALFPSYPSGSILGFPPLTPSSSAPITTSSITVITAAPVTTASTAKIATDPSVPVQTQKNPASLPTALGVGIGVPLGIATIGFLGFLFWREAARRRRSKPRTLSQEAVLNQTNKSAVAAVDGSSTESRELPDAQRLREMDGTVRMELSCI
ncbi:hypothetical protein BDR22DRAFT_837375 [Usnea florida]